MSKRKRILFVDDEPSIRLTLPSVLEENGYEVSTAGSVDEAISKIGMARYDVLLSDLNISEEGDGFRVVRAMRSSQPKCLTVIITGYPGFETAIEGIRQQVDDYLVKPADVGALLETLNRKLAERSPKS